MTEPLISVDHVSVTFPIFDRPSRTLTGRLARGNFHAPAKHFEALKDVTFSVPAGENVGLIGHNGAGKSTLLRTIGGIYVPSRGTITRRGKVRCLFEISAGVNGDATGYENIPLLAAANGIPLAKVPQLVTDVEEFTELGEALSRPVRTYSSGMRLRIAFAIATAVHSDILLMDEVIGVGDRNFRDKARIRIESMMERAGTLLLASHSEAYLKTYCQRGLVFEKGRILFDGKIGEAISFFNGRPNPH
ncbi:MAG: ABC transporter ATP-binding protein [Rhizobiaceae bacterium]|nr:ABC transporter ATP-binding protein [Rhizobiaceae bacterium]